MKVKVLLLVVSLASLLAALVCASGAIINRGGPTAGAIIIDRGQPTASAIIIERGGSGSGGSTAA